MIHGQYLISIEDCYLQILTYVHLVGIMNIKLQQAGVWGIGSAFL